MFPGLFAPVGGNSRGFFIQICFPVVSPIDKGNFNNFAGANVAGENNEKWSGFSRRVCWKRPAFRDLAGLTGFPKSLIL